MKRNISLDFLKVVASIMIVCHHYQQIFDLRFSKMNFWGGKFPFGDLVELFFIISGICAIPYIDKISNNENFVQFYGKRMKRLLPMTTISVLCMTFLNIVSYWKRGTLLCGTLSPSGILFSCIGVQDGWATQNPGINNPIWYVSVLLLCYLWMYIAVWISKKLKTSPFYFFAVIVFVGMGIQTYSIEFPFLNNSASRGYISFFAGLIYAYFAKKIDIEKIWIQILAAFAFCGTILGLKYSLFGMSENNVVFVFWPSLLVIMNSKLVKKVIRGEFWSKWAEISFDVWSCVKI